MSSYLRRFLEQGTAAAGGVMFRDIDTVHRQVGREVFFREIKARGWRLLRVGEQYVVVCRSSFSVLS